MRASSSTFQSHRGLYVLLLAVLILAGVLRFANLPRQGLFEHDEATYLLETQFISSSFAYVRANLGEIRRNGLSFADAEWVNRNLEGIHINTAKPGHTVLIWLASRITGFRDYTPLFVAAVFGLASVLMVYVLGSRLYGPWQGLLAAGVMASSEYAIMYSRSGLAEADSSFFFIPATLFYYLSRKTERRPLVLLALAGLFVGAGYVSNWRWALIPILFLLFEAHVLILERKRAMLDRIKRFVVLAGGIGLPLLLFEAPYRLVMLVTGKVPYYPFSYFEQLADRHSRYSGRFNLEDVFDPVRYLWNFQGALVFALIVAGLVVALWRLHRRRDVPADLVVLGQFIVPLVFWSVYSSYDARFPRSLVTILPAAALLAGLGGVAIAETIGARLRRLRLGPQSFAVALLLAILAFGAVRSWSLLSMRSGYKQAATAAADYSLRTGKPISADLFHWPLWKFYGQEIARQRGVPLEQIVVQADGAEKGLIPVALGSYLDAGEERFAQLRKLEEQTPVVAVPNGIGTPNLYEAGLRWGRVAELLSNSDIRFVMVYDVQ